MFYYLSGKQQFNGKLINSLKIVSTLYCVFWQTRKLDVFKVSIYGVQMTVKSVTSVYSISEQKSYAEFIV